MQYVKALRTSTSLILGFTLTLMLTISGCLRGSGRTSNDGPSR